MLIKDMVEIPSPTGSEGKLVDFLISWANENGYSSRKDEVGNFIAERGSGKEILCVGHVDTAPGEIDVTIEGGKLYGRGAVDAKGPLACFLEAARDISSARIVIVGAVDEEGDSKGARGILGRYDPEFIIVGEPSGWSSVNLGYKGCLNLYYTNEQEGEHTSSGRPNCNEEAVGFFSKLKEFSDEYNSAKSLFKQIGIKLISINSSHDGLNERTLMNVNLRIPIGLDSEHIKKFIEDNKGCAKIEYSTFERPVKVGKDNRLVSNFIRSIRDAGGDVRFKLKSGTSDMNILQDYNVPMVTYGPGDYRLEHTPCEYMDLDEYERSIGILKSVFKGL